MITIKLTKSGVWIASKMGERTIVGRGDSSVEAHLDLLEKTARKGSS